MNQALLNRHYETVSTDDMLIHLGDVAMDMRDGSETIRFFDRLSGDMLIRGNHDTGLIAEDAPFLVAQSCVLAHGDRRFYCTHRPSDIPPEWEGWAIHGHMHNNDTEKFPFIAERECRINVSCELLNYRPIQLSTVAKMIDACPP
jgi:Predicted phosphoesterase or phosphohydrolase